MSTVIFADSLCLPPSGNSTGQMGTTSAWPTQTATTAASSSPTRRALSVSGELRFSCVTELDTALPSDRARHYTSELSCVSPGLSIDFDTEQLYWISSGNSTINRCKLDGSGLEVLEGVKGKLTKATALAIMGTSPENVHFSHWWRQSVQPGHMINLTVLQIYISVFKC